MIAHIGMLYFVYINNHGVKHSWKTLSLTDDLSLSRINARWETKAASIFSTLCLFGGAAVPLPLRQKLLWWEVEAECPEFHPSQDQSHRQPPLVLYHLLSNIKIFCFLSACKSWTGYLSAALPARITSWLPVHIYGSQKHLG